MNDTKLNYIISIPERFRYYRSPQQLLEEKLHTVSTRFLDKLHPAAFENPPYVEYVDEGLWKSRITFHKDYTPTVINDQIRAQTDALQGRAFRDLDALCEAELQRRYPEYTVIQGMKATCKNRFPHLYRLIVGTEAFYKQLTQKEVNKYKKQIAYSACNRDDLHCKPTIVDPDLRQSLNLSDDTVLESEHHFAKNSPMNGKSFLRDGQIVHLTQAIACSNDRKVENTGNLRVVQTRTKESLCYTGRADSNRKALEQASFIFLNELKTKGKGITQSIDEHGNILYHIDYVVSSLLSTPWITGAESPLVTFPEREYLLNERQAFDQLKKNGPIAIADPNCPGRTYLVRFNPILFSRSMNIFTRLENWFPPFFTGSSHAQEISQEGYAALAQLAQQKIATLHEQRTAASAQKIQAIESTLYALTNPQNSPLRPEEELLLRDYLCKLLGLPLVYHCKSSTDRTSIANALSTTVYQWFTLNLPLPTNLRDLLQDFRFKELFAANWMTGHQITRYARGAEGTVCGEKLNNENLGLSLSRGIAQNPTIAHLVPERYLKPFPTPAKLKTSAVYFLLLLPLSLLLYVPLTAITAVRHIAYVATLGKNPHWIGPGKFTLPVLPLTLIFNFPSIFPEKVLNESSPQIGERRLIAGGYKGGQDDDN